MAMNENSPVTRRDMRQMNEQMKSAPRSSAGITGKPGKNVAPLYSASVKPIETLPRKVEKKTTGFGTK